MRHLIFTITLLTISSSVSSLLACDNYTDGGSIGSGENPVITTHCYNYAHQPPITPSTPSGGSGGGPVYQWEAAFGGSSWQTITGADGNAFQYLVHASTLASMGYSDDVTLELRRAVRRDDCADWVYTNVRVFEIVGEVNPGELREYASWCTDFTSLPTGASLNLQSPSDGDQPYEYRWEISTDGSNWSFYATELTPIIDISPGTLRHFRRGVRPEGSDCPFRYTNSVEFYYLISDFLLTLNSTNPSCFGADDGELEVVDGNGNTPEVFGAIEFTIDGVNWLPNVSIFTDLTAGTYNVQARSLFSKDCLCMDSYDGTYYICEVSEVTLTTPPPLAYDDVITTDATDCNEEDGAIVFTISGGVSPYIITAFSSGDHVIYNTNELVELENLPADEYDILIEDSSGGGCSILMEGVLIMEPPTPIINSVNVMQPSPCGIEDGSIMINASAGTGSFEYSVNGMGGPWYIDAIISDLGVGTYMVSVRNTDGSCPVSWTETIFLMADQAPELLAVNLTDPTDCGAEDGTITIIATQGEGSYAYSIDGENGTWSADNEFTNLAPGTYEVWVRNASGTCPVGGEAITLSDPPQPELAAVDFTDPTDCGAEDGTITIIATQGEGSYAYSIDGENGTWSADNEFTNLAPGTYEIWVRNASGTCPVGGEAITLSDPPQPELVAVDFTDPTDCGAEDGTITIIATQGEGDYAYSIDGENGTWSADNEFTNLAPGTYEVWVRNASGTCPVGGEAITLSDPPQPGLSAVDFTDPTDCGAEDGTITIIATQGESSYAYSIDGENGTWSADNEFINLAPGTYEIWVRNASGTCPVGGEAITLSDPVSPFIAQVLSSDATDCDVSDGQIEIVSEGNADYEYSIDGANWQLSSVFIDLEAGTYTAFIRNEDETCVESFAADVLIEAPDAPTIIDVVVVQLSDCGAEDAMIDITASIGSGDLQYNIGFGWDNQSSFMGLPAGNYSIAVRNDDESCAVDYAVEVVIEPILIPEFIGATATDISDCQLEDGSIEVIATSGDGNLLYSLDGTLWQNSNLFEELAAGTYLPQISNGNGSCVIDGDQVVIIAPEAPAIDFAVAMDVTDCENEDGMINISGSGGDGNLLYAINGTDWQSSSIFENLPAGSYIPLVSNSDGSCITSGQALTIAAPTAPELTMSTATDATNCEEANGSITLTATGGDGNLLYAINGTDWQSSSIFDNLPAGTYIPLVSNSDGSCITSGQALTIAAPTAPELTMSTATDATNCEEANGSITLTATGGDGNLLYAINGTDWQSSSIFDNLPAGTYIPLVSNSDGSCITSGQALTIAAPTAPELTMSTATDATNCEEANGSITLTATGGDGNLLYAINGTDWQSSSIFENLPAGSYIPLVSNSDGSCITSGETVEVTAVAAPSLSEPLIVETSGCEENDASITLNASGGTGDLQYSINGEMWQSSPLFANLMVGEYVPYVSNEDGSCTVLGDSILIVAGAVYPDVVLSNLLPILPSNCTANNGEIIFESSGGSGEYEYSIDGGQNWQNDSIFANLPMGYYQIILRDALQTCQITAVLDLEFFPAFAPELQNVVAIAPSDCGTNDGAINISATTPTGNLLYTFDGGLSWAEAAMLTQQTSGNYTVGVQNPDNGCVVWYPEEVILTAPVLPELDSISSVQISDCGLTDGSIVLHTTSSDQTLEISWNNTPWQWGETLSGLPAGEYFISYRNIDGTCVQTWPEAIILTEPVEPTIESVNFTAPSDCDTADGQITIVPLPGEDWEYRLGPDEPWSTNLLYENLPAGSYIIEVRSAAWPNCVAMYPETIVLDGSLNLSDVTVAAVAADDCFTGGEFVLRIRLQTIGYTALMVGVTGV